jgi:hypothetical protein
MSYPESLIKELAKYGEKPTGDVEWDRAVLMSLRNDKTTYQVLHKVAVKAAAEASKNQLLSMTLADDEAYKAHSRLLIWIANNVVLKSQRRRFVVDKNNEHELRFLLYYFNGCPLCEDVFPGRGYKLHKPVLLQGGKGVGKTLMMQIFSEYLRLTSNPRYFHNISVTEMVDYYSLHNNIDLYTFNQAESRGFACKPENVCLNDICILTRKHFGVDTNELTNEFLLARNEVWVTYGKFAHLTTNLSAQQLKDYFLAQDPYGRIVDRLKTYNVIPIMGESRR